MGFARLFFCNFYLRHLIILYRKTSNVQYPRSKMSTLAPKLNLLIFPKATDIDKPPTAAPDCNVLSGASSLALGPTPQ